MLALIAKATPDFEPDTKHLYSNSGYSLLSLIVARLAPARACLKDRMLELLCIHGRECDMERRRKRPSGYSLADINPAQLQPSVAM